MCLQAIIVPLRLHIGCQGAGSAGALYLLFFKPCEFNQYPGLNFWSGGNTLYSNWNYATQTVSDSLTFEQCTFKAFETNAPNMTYNSDDGRCICKDSTAILAASTELSTSFTNGCNSFNATNTTDQIIENRVKIFPNPTSSELFLEINHASFTEEDRISLFSVLGEQLYSSRIYSQQSQINLSDYPKGVYILVATVNGISKTVKVLKE